MPSTVHQFMPADDGPKIILLDLQSTLSANFRQMGTNPVPARIRDEEQYKQYLVDWLRQVQQVGWEVHLFTVRNNDRRSATHRPFTPSSPTSTLAVCSRIGEFTAVPYPSRTTCPLCPTSLTPELLTNQPQRAATNCVAPPDETECGFWIGLTSAVPRRWRRISCRLTRGRNFPAAPGLQADDPTGRGAPSREGPHIRHGRG